MAQGSEEIISLQRVLRLSENERRFLEEYRKASNYQPEDCHGNRSDNQKSKKRNCDSKK